jgi:hypothetical protein
MKKRGAWSLGGWCLALLLGTAAPAGAQSSDPVQDCVNNAMIACFDGCNNPLNFQECIIGCAAGGNVSPQNCRDQCFNDATCESTCMANVNAIRACVGATQKVDVVRGAVALNRATGTWQQTLKLTNNTALETLQNLVLVLDELAAGWTLANADGASQVLQPSGRPFKNVADRLAPGASVTLVLQFARTGTPAFSYTPLVYISALR